MADEKTPKGSDPPSPVEEKLEKKHQHTRRSVSNNRFIKVHTSETWEIEEEGLCDKLTQCCRRENPEHVRYASNYISTTKYNLLTFIPKNLFEQFQKKANLYFLITAIISLTPLSPKTPVVSVAPLVFVLAVSACKEAIEDWARYKMDLKVNNTQVKVWKENKFIQIAWKHLQVGHLVMIEADQAFPADLCLLKTSTPLGSCTIETANLDGETNLKVKQAVPETYNLPLGSDQNGGTYLSTFPRSTLQSSAPNKLLTPNGWTANLAFEGKERDDQKIALGFNQLLLRGCTLRGTKWVIAIVLFTGEETKLMLNNSPAKFKRSNVDRLVDQFLYVLFGLQAVLCSLGAILNSHWMSNNGLDHWYLPYRYENYDFTTEAAASFLTYLVLLDILIPISLYVSMELVKFSQAWFISKDLDMYYAVTDTPAQARTSNLNEELGQIGYIFSDKTGTLTANIMKFIQCSVDGVSYGGGFRSPTQPDLQPGIPPRDDLPFYDHRMEVTLLSEPRDRAKLINEFLTLLSTCHTVLPEFPTCQEDHVHLYEKCGAVADYQAQSPDEKALVIAAKFSQYYFYHTEPELYTVGACDINGNSCRVNILGQHHKFDVYEVFKFSSERARMSVILRDPRDGKIKIYTKGSDTKMFPMLTEESKARLWEKTNEQLTEFARYGLRTLVCGYRVIEEKVFEEWMTRHKAAMAAVNNRGERVALSYAEMERDLTLVGTTAIEDKLQDGVPETIATLAKAGIKIWVLTGDKVETAINIGKSARLLTPAMQDKGFIELVVPDDIDDDKGRRDVMALLADAKQRTADIKDVSDDLAIVVSGRALTFIFPPRSKDPKTGKYIKPTPEQLAKELEIQMSFLSVCTKCKAVICCRVSPNQKAEVVLLVKNHVKGSVTLAIGDGANDVSMIKAAHVGIGISGLEGLQAVMASDYAIAQFRFLQTLLLVHGQWSYRRTSLLILYSFYKNICISFTQVWFAIYSGWSAQMFYDAYAGSAFNMIFTAFPIMLAAIFNHETSKENALKFPETYKTGIRNETFNLAQLLTVILEAALQSLVLYFFPSEVLDRSPDPEGMFHDQWMTSTTMYTCLIILVSLRVGLDTVTWNWLHFLFWILSVAVWFLFLIVYSAIQITPDMYWVGLRLVGDMNYWLLVLLLPTICILPDVGRRFYHRQYQPTMRDLIAEYEQGDLVLSEEYKQEQSLENKEEKSPIIKSDSKQQLRKSQSGSKQSSFRGNPAVSTLHSPSFEHPDGMYPSASTQEIGVELGESPKRGEEAHVHG